MRGIILILVLVFSMMSQTIHGKESQENSHFDKKNSFSAKGGYHIFMDSGFTDAWNPSRQAINESNINDSGDMNGGVGELAYERILYENILGAEIAIGYFIAGKNYNYLITSGGSTTTSSTDIKIESLYISPSFKLHLPVLDSFAFYAGGGPDYYKTWIRHGIQSGSASVNREGTFNTFGFHGLGGVDWFVFKKPSEGEYDIPLSLFAEYKYTRVKVNDADKAIIDYTNMSTGSAYSKNDLEIGGHSLLFGVRWHF
ncbi:MAG: hypothetical protein HZA01_05015 [Nitrospinae bacterium]|nr:hypothetical protein [Nitrospinota bacterium]